MTMRCLAALECGYTAAECANGLAVTPATIRRHLVGMQCKVFDFTDINGDPHKLRTWVRRHFSCCTRSAVAMIENGQIFA